MNLESTFQSILGKSLKRNNKYISVFDCKCVIIQLFGINISSKEIISILCSKCNWKLDDYGINIEQFKILIHYYKDQLKNDSKDNSILKYYYNFDNKQKGWISEDDFINQFNMVTPYLATRYGHTLFNLADINNNGRITQRYYTTCLNSINHELKND